MDLAKSASIPPDPALFHYNHPFIPGYFSNEVPHGIQCFELNDVQQQFVSDAELTLNQPLKTTEHGNFGSVYHGQYIV